MQKTTEIENIRHSLAHLLAAALKRFYPKAQLGIGPVIENGFYYDFALPADLSAKALASAEALSGVEGAKARHFITDTDLARIEKEMREIAMQNLPFKKELWPAVKSLAYFKQKKQPYKIELIEDLTRQPKSKLQAASYNLQSMKVGMVYTGDVFLDLCRGGHVKNTKELPLDAFKLTRVAGAYWRGDEKNPMLTRVYGVAFETKKELDQYVKTQEEAAKRDHKKLGPELGLFMFSSIVGPGLPLLLPKGFQMRKVIEDYLFEVKKRYGLIFVWTPHIAKSALYIKSKHWQKYDAMMPPLEIEGEQYTIKPMNCPHHFQIYLNSPKSYHDLPLRLAENATVYRYEKSGEINGLLRVRALTQDDSHWFVPHDLLAKEIDKAIQLTQEIYQTFGLRDYRARISIRDKKNKEKYLGKDALWNTAEKELLKAVQSRNIPYEIGEGEAAFYGPKIDLLVKDVLGREWQITTIQLDFNQPENFDLVYMDRDGTKKQPAILHIAVLGSIERFMAILIENYAGSFPFWLAPEQIWILPISDKFHTYAKKVMQALARSNPTARVIVRDENETLGKKIREGELQKIPYLLIVGEKEQTQGTISLRKRGKGDIGQMRLEQFLAKIKQEIEEKST